MVPETVQLIVEVAGLWNSAPAFDVTRPAGIAPRCSAQTKRSNHSARFAGSSTDARALATRWYVPSISRSTGSPDLVFSRYFVSQMLSEASWSAMSASLDALSSNAMFIVRPFPFLLGIRAAPFGSLERVDVQASIRPRKLSAKDTPWLACAAVDSVPEL